MSWLNEKIPDMTKAYIDMIDATYKKGALDIKTKELISTASSILMRCEKCTKIHVERAKKNGATDEQIAEAIACAMFVAAGSQLSWGTIYDKIVK